MSQASKARIWIDTDNAMGSLSGDIDDALAIAALFFQDANIVGISSVFGNTSQRNSFKNCSTLVDYFKSEVPLYPGANRAGEYQSSASQALSRIQEPTTILALGPLTNIAAALHLNPGLRRHLQEIIFVGLNFDFKVPSWRFFDFNVYQDKAAAAFILKQGIKMTIAPCNQARKIRMSQKDLEVIPGELGEHVRRCSKRWFLRAKLMKLQKTIPVWDLCAGLYWLKPELFVLEPAEVKTTNWGSLHLLPSTKPTHIQSIVGLNESSRVSETALQVLQFPKADHLNLNRTHRIDSFDLNSIPKDI